MQLKILAAVMAAVAPTSTLTVMPWPDAAVSSGQWESHPAIDPLTGDLWFVRSDATFSGWRLMVSRCAGGVRTAPVPAPLAAPGLQADPYFTADGRTLYFISSRATASMSSAGLDIWRARRTRAGQWGAPERLGEPINSAAAEWFPRPAPDGWLYFGSGRAGGLGRTDIWRAREVAGRWVVENAGPAINTAGDEYEFEPSPDGRWAIVATASGFYRVDRGADGWINRRAYGPEINATGTEIGPMIAPDGRAFAFSRDAGDGKSGELFVARTGRSAAWPPACPGLKRRSRDSR